MLSTRFSGLGDRREKRTVEIESRESRKAVPQSGAWGMCADFETTRWTRREQRVFCGVVVIILRFPFKIAADHQGVPAASHSSRGSRGQRRFKRRRRSSLRSKKWAGLLERALPNRSRHQFFGEASSVFASPYSGLDCIFPGTGRPTLESRVWSDHRRPSGRRLLPAQLVENLLR